MGESRVDLLGSNWMEEFRRGLRLGAPTSVYDRWRQLSRGLDLGSSLSTAPATAPAAAPASTANEKPSGYYDWKPSDELREAAWKMIADAIGDDRYSPELRFGLWEALHSGRLPSDLVRRLYEERAQLNKTQGAQQAKDNTGSQKSNSTESWFDPRMFWMALMMRLMMQ